MTTKQKYIGSINVAKSLDDELLLQIGSDVVEDFDADLASRASWEDALEEWTKLALQVREEKTWPWPRASNVKYPLLTTAAMQFNARAYPALVPNDNKVVKCRVIGSDPDGKKAGRAARLSTFLSYQVMDEMQDWEEETDRLLTILPIIGCVFRKTYYDPLLETNRSYLVYPKDFVINYWTKSLEQSYRYTQIIRLTKNEVKERINKKLFLDVDLGEPTIETFQKNSDPNELTPTVQDETTPYTFLEMHTWLDLDEDDYDEPYVITVDYKTKKVVRIVPRFDENCVEIDDKGKIVRIEAIQYFTKFGFIPNPEGGFYDIGFGLLLGSINESVNTLINQLIDAGTLANLQSGFLAKGLRLKLGDSKFQPGEWKYVNATGDDLKKSIFPLPTREPSQVLFELLGTLIQSGKELASVSEIFVGKMPGQNTPATTTQSTIEQGMKLFTAIFKRVYRSMAKEFQKIYLLNQEHYDREKYLSIVDSQDPEAQKDLDGPEDDIIPAADPQATTDFEKMNKATAVIQLVQMGTVNPQEATKRFLEANGISDIDVLMNVPPPPPDPKTQEMQMKMQMEQQKHQQDMQASAQEMQLSAALAQIQMQVEQQRLELEKMRLQIEQERAQFELAVKRQDAALNVQMAAQQHQQKMQQQQEAHTQKQKLASEKGTNDTTK